MRTSRFLAVVSVVLFLAFILGCSEEQNPVQSQTSGEISGTITFTGTWPAKGNVQVSMWTSWPPAGPPAAFSAPLTPGVATQTFKISGLNKGPYSVITVGWRDPADPTGAKVIGVYTGNDVLGVDCKGDFTLPALPVEIAEGRLKYTNINIRANLDILHLGEISGKVNFVGNWPSRGEVQVSLWASWPPAGPPAYASPAFAPGNMSPSYKLQCIVQKTYPVLTVGWRDPANPAGAKVLGIYWAQNDSLAVDGNGRTLPGVQPLPITISEAKLNWSNVNIKANLGIAQ
ncbi:MAG: hypothetical protein ONB46_12490 [candidate division KSB1 bacterium]|nr:hypothetical protein [candidate division KSB1 bacterium]MDZ7366537.1 hypothetical protein [candidate division KSB1 bacterium]MDZ7405980.1 hypothetical protein [candidate division KSB1 bacterium]